MEECSTIVIPIQFNSKKRWSRFSDQIFEKLKSWNQNARFEWKKVNYSENFDSKYYVSDNAAFESDEDKKMSEESYFYEEAYRTIYDKDCAVSCIFILTENGNVVLENSNLSVLFNDHSRSIRKLYLYLTNSHTGLLIVEMNVEELLDGNDSGIDSIIDSERKICITENDKETVCDLLEWSLGKKANELDCFLPFKRKCFLATYRVDESIPTDNSKEKELDIFNVTLDSFIMKGWGTKGESGSFFSHYFQIFWLCILQKTEILHISHMAGKISRRKNLFFMRGDIVKVNKEYVLFYNQYDLIECTYDAMGEKLYRKVREYMNIYQDNADVREQMNTLHEYAVLVTGRWINIWLTILSVVCSVFTILEFFLK